MDVLKQVEYWLSGVREDWAAAETLVQRGHLRHGLFFAHLSLEKALKGLVCKRTGDLPPRIHNLVRLAELAGATMPPGILDCLAEMNQFNQAGRYPGPFLEGLGVEEAARVMVGAKEALEWLTSLY